MLDLVYVMNGAVSGAFGIACSHPFDTVKTYMQNNKPVPRSIVSLYRGIRPAIIGVGFEKAIVFGTYENMNRVLNKHSIDTNASIGISGGMAGGMASIIVTPVDRLKILAQTGKKITLNDFNPMTLYRGITATYTREVPGFSIYFLTYENLKNRYIKKHTTDLPLPVSFAYGGISGAVAWCFIYPQDVIKTRMQSSNNNNMGFVRTLQQVFRERGLFKGFHFALIRAVPLHAGTFMMMEVMKNLHK